MALSASLSTILSATSNNNSSQVNSSMPIAMLTNSSSQAASNATSAAISASKLASSSSSPLLSTNTMRILPDNGSSSGGNHARGHIRRQSVARLLPDISKLRLLSWLVEASGELLKCDAAIMDGVHAKLNKSQESLFLWSSGGGGNAAADSQLNSLSPVNHHNYNYSYNHNHRLLSNHHSQQQFDSLPVSYSNSSATASNDQFSVVLPASRQISALFDNCATTDKSFDKGANDDSNDDDATSDHCNSNNNAADADDEDDSCSSNSSHSSSNASSSGVQSSANSSLTSHSLSPTALVAASSNNNTSNNNTSNLICSKASDEALAAHCPLPQATRRVPPARPPPPAFMAHRLTCGRPAANAAAEHLRSLIRQAMLEHNRLQALLVNIIRQYDRLKQRHALEHGSAPLRVDLSAIANSLDDGCQCACHLHQQVSYKSQREKWAARANTLPIAEHAQQELSPPTTPSANKQTANKQNSALRRHKNSRTLNSILPSNNNNQINDEQLKCQQFAICENCAETHYWLHADDEFAVPTSTSTLTTAATASATTTTTTSSNSSSTSSNTSNKLSSSTKNNNASNNISQRNANFIKLVQQQIRATLAKSIELIDLIRKEIKSPESIKQTHLMQCFASSIQLLTSVGCYVMPAQYVRQHINVSSFILEPSFASSTLGKSITASLPTSPSLIKASGSNSNNSAALSSSSSLSTGGQLPGLTHNHNLHHHNHHLNKLQRQKNEVESNTAPTNPTGLFKLPDSDFEYLPFSQPPPVAAEFQSRGYHLAAAPELPVKSKHIIAQNNNSRSNCSSFNNNNAFNATTNSLQVEHKPQQQQQNKQQHCTNNTQTSTINSQNHDSQSNCSNQIDNNSTSSTSISCSISKQQSDFQATTDRLRKLNTADTLVSQAESTTSGASSLSSSASSSMTRDASNQQGSVSRLATQNYFDSRKQSKLFSSGQYQTNNNSNNKYNKLDFFSSSNNNNRFSQTEFDDYSNSDGLKFWQSSKFNFIRKLLQVKRQRMLRQQKKDRKIYNHKIQSKLRLVIMDFMHFNKSRQLLATENGVNSLLTSMRNALEFGLYLTLKLY